MDFERQLAETIRFVYLILVFFLPFLFTSINKPLIWGLIFGIIVSIVNAIQIGNRLKKISELPLQRAVTYMKIGYGMRFLLIILSLMLAFKHPEYLNLKATALGIFIAPFIAIVLYGYKLLHKNYL